jgi:GTP-binding protein HflX
LEAVHQLLDGLSCDQLRKVVANQIDRCEASAIDAIRTLEPDVIYLSATEGTGLKGLRNWLEKQFWDGATPPVSITQKTSFPDHG